VYEEKNSSDKTDLVQTVFFVKTLFVHCWGRTVRIFLNETPEITGFVQVLVHYKDWPQASQVYLKYKSSKEPTHYSVPLDLIETNSHHVED
jgi:hypothetical protein